MFRWALRTPQHTIITPRNAHNCPLRVAPHEIVNGGAEPVEVGTSGRSHECRGVELVRSGARKCARHLTRPLEAPVACNDIVQPQNLTRQAALARPRQKAPDPRSVRATRLTKRMREQKGAFAFPEIPVDFLAVSRQVPLEV